MTDGTDRSEERASPRTPRRRRRRLIVALAVPLVIVLCLTATGWAALGRTLSAPDWLRARIESRLDQALPGIEIRFGDMRLRVERDLLARIVLSDVDVRSDAGAHVATLSDLSVGLAPTKLLRGEYELRTARMSGAVVTVRRDEAGRLGLALGDVFSGDTRMPGVPEIIDRLDAALGDPRLQALSAVDAEALTIRFEDARAHRGWTADGGRLRLTRENGALRLAGDVALIGRGDVAATIALNAESPIGSTRVDFGLSLDGLEAGDIASQSPALAWLDSLRAPISGAVRGSITPDGALGGLNATLQIGAGVLQPNARTRAIPFDMARTYLSFDPATADLTFDEISVQSSLGTLIADGKAVLDGLDTGWPRAIFGQFRITRFEADPAGFLDSRLELAGAEIDWQLQLSPFRFELGRFRSTDPQLPLRLSGALEAEREGWRLSLDGSLEGADRDTVLAYWPQRAVAKTRKWVAENVHAGRVEDVTFALRLGPDQPPEPYVDMRLADVELTYARTLPRLTGGEGQLTFFRNRLAVTLESGGATPPEGGRLDASGSRFVIPDTKARPAMGELTLNARGPLTAALSYLDSPKLEIMQKAGKPVTLGSGELSAEGTLVLPLQPGIKREDMLIQATGVLRDARSDQIVPGRVLSGDSFAVELSDGVLTVSGAADLSGVPFEGTWTQPIDGASGSRVDGTVTLSDEVARSLGIGLPKGTFSGRGAGRVTIELPKGQPPRFALSSDLAGLGMSLPQLGWRLSEGGKGKLEVAGRLGKPVEVERLSLSAGGLDAQGKVTLAADGSFRRLDLPVLRAGGWLNSSAVLTGRGRNAAPGVTLTGGSIDMRSAPFGGGGGGGGSGNGGPITVAVDRLQVTDGIFLTDFRGQFDGKGGLSGNFTGRIGGGTDITGQIVPQNGGSAIRVKGHDAGNVLKGAGLLRTVKDGALDLSLVPVRGRPGEYDGSLKIDEVRLRNAPAIAALLDAVSVVGLLDQLNGPGIYFTEVEAIFRMTPQQVILTRSSAVGPSMGISMDGYYNVSAGTMDMQGVVSPIYILNAIGRLFARKGEGLIGFNFNLRGPVAGPSVSVNPLSALTPGMFRDIFRRPPPTLPDRN
ncbi:DUF3971 domain-containing protein [Salipiger sp.]|uniref:YhdP family protein n=1 Tax=Salipiger sp. TaxID=2078585 RepID=UPI003A97528B